MRICSPRLVHFLWSLRITLNLGRSSSFNCSFSSRNNLHLIVYLVARCSLLVEVVSYLFFFKFCLIVQGASHRSRSNSKCRINLVSFWFYASTFLNLFSLKLYNRICISSSRSCLSLIIPPTSVSSSKLLLLVRFLSVLLKVKLFCSCWAPTSSF